MGLKLGGQFRPLAIKGYHFFLRLAGRSPAVTCAPVNRGIRQKPDFAVLEKQYLASDLAQEPESFVLYRIIGNDLPPRHRKGQSRDSLAFILEHEPELPGCEKRFVVNRIVDETEEAAVVSMLTRAGKGFVHIPFDRSAYRGLGWDMQGVPETFMPGMPGFQRLNLEQQGRVLMRLYRNKNNYVMHCNGARNTASDQARKIAKWVMPWDGNCFVTRGAWDEIVRAVCKAPHMPYVVVPMARITDNLQLLDSGYRPKAVEEPQVIFRKNALLRFDENFFYGRRDKVELLWRLGVPGRWDRWEIEPWDLPAPAFADQAGAFAAGGWVARLDSGQANLEKQSEAGSIQRMTSRVEAVRRLLDHLDKKTGNPRFDVAFPGGLYDKESPC